MKLTQRHLQQLSGVTLFAAFAPAFDVAKNIVSSRLDSYFQTAPIAQWGSIIALVLLGACSLWLWHRSRLLGLQGEYAILVDAEDLKPEHLGFVRVAPGISLHHLPGLHQRPFVEGTYIPRRATPYEERHSSNPSITYDEQRLQTILEDGSSFLLIGQPTEGKTRTLFELSRRLKGYLVAAPGPRQMSEGAIDLLRGRAVLFLFDDINQSVSQGADLADFYARASKVVVRCPIAAACRDGVELAALKLELVKNPLQKLIEGIPHVLSLQSASENEKVELGKWLHAPNDRPFPSLGAVSMDEAFSIMRRRFALLPLTTRETLWSVQLLASVGIEPIEIRFVSIALTSVFSHTASSSEMRENLAHLANNGFMLSSSERDCVVPEAAYILGPEVAQYYRDGQRSIEADVATLVEALFAAEEAQALLRMAVARSAAADHTTAFDLWRRVADQFAQSSKPRLLAASALAMLEVGLLCLRLYLPDLAKNFFTRIVDRYGNDPASEIKEIVAKALFELGLTTMEGGRPDLAIPYFSAVVDRYGKVASPVLRDQTARSIMNRGVALGLKGLHGKAIQEFDRVILDYGNDGDGLIREHVARASVNKCAAVRKLSTPNAAAAACQSTFLKLHSDSLPSVREQAARSLLMKAQFLAELATDLRDPADQDAVSACYDLLVDTFSKDSAFGVRHRVASALLEKTAQLCRDEAFVEATAALDILIASYGEDPYNPTQAIVATAMSDKAQLQERVDPERVLSSYDQVLIRYREHPDPALRAIAAKAWSRKATFLLATGRPVVAIEVLDAIIKEYEGDSAGDLQIFVEGAKRLRAMFPLSSLGSPPDFK